MTTPNSISQQLRFTSPDKKLRLRLNRFSEHAEMAMLIPAPKNNSAQTLSSGQARLISIEVRQAESLLAIFTVGPLVSRSGLVLGHIAPLSSELPLQLKLTYKDYTTVEFTIPVEWKHPDTFNPRPAASPQETTSQ